MHDYLRSSWLTAVFATQISRKFYALADLGEVNHGRERHKGESECVVNFDQAKLVPTSNLKIRTKTK